MPLSVTERPMTTPWIVRAARREDCAAVLPLMRGLAEFEDYVDAFAATVDVLRRQGFERTPPDFHMFVAEASGGAIVGADAVWVDYALDVSAIAQLAKQER